MHALPAAESPVAVGDVSTLPDGDERPSRETGVAPAIAAPAGSAGPHADQREGVFAGERIDRARSPAGAPMIAMAQLVRRETADGCSFVKDDVPIGKVYRVHAPGVMKSWMIRRTGQVVPRLSVQDVDSGGWMPAELLRFLD